LLAESILSRVIPGATRFDPEWIPGLSPGVWEDFDIDGSDPSQVANALVGYCESVLAGLVIIVTFDSFRNNVGPFFVLKERLSEFASSYPEIYDDVLVGGDVVMLSPSTGRVVVVHHSGLITTLSGVVCADLLN
jgi:hypothetical protein